MFPCLGCFHPAPLPRLRCTEDRLRRAEAGRRGRTGGGRVGPSQEYLDNDWIDKVLYSVQRMAK